MSRWRSALYIGRRLVPLRLGEAALDASNHRRRLLVVGVGKQQHELIAADPGQQVGGAQDGLRRLRQMHERGVTGGVTALAVDPLEAVEVEERHRQRFARALGARKLELGPFLACPPVRQAGQRVVPRLVRLTDERLAQPVDDGAGGDEQGERGHGVRERDAGADRVDQPVGEHSRPRAERTEQRDPEAADPGHEGDAGDVHDR